MKDYEEALRDWQENGQMMSEPTSIPCIRGSQERNWAHDYVSTTKVSQGGAIVRTEVFVHCRQCGMTR